MDVLKLILDKKAEYVTRRYLDWGEPKRIILSFNYHTELQKAVNQSGQPLIYDIVWHNQFSRCHGKIFGMQITLTERKKYIRILPEKMVYKSIRRMAELLDIYPKT